MEQGKETNDTHRLCRPPIITCRWIAEISEAIHNVCPSQQNILQVDCKASQIDHLWKSYYKRLQHSPCIDNPVVKRILSFDIDYNEFRAK